jgi:spermidine synthase
MNRKAFLLGLFSIGGQVLLLRELVSSLNGDELFICTALFGWLVSVAIGSYFGGKSRLTMKPSFLFILGTILLPILVVLIRLSPTMAGFEAGEIIPFIISVLISIACMFPLGAISGALFSAITKEGYRPAESIAQVYLFEGLGAFVGGILNTALVGVIFSTLAMALGFGLIVIMILLIGFNRRRDTFYLAIYCILLLALKIFIPDLDKYLDSVKYVRFNVENSFDTHYGHQTILSKDGTISLLTDNSVEATHPDLYSTENLLIPPLLYRPQARNILFMGRAELGIMQLAEKFPDIKITAIDQRDQLSSLLDSNIKSSGKINRLDDDPVAFLAKRSFLIKYDIIIINGGEPDSYKSNRLMTDRFLMTAGLLLKDSGVIYLPSRYDSDRYISQEKRGTLSIIYNTLKKSFKYVSFWPGEMTLFLASNKPIFDLPMDSILNRINNLPYVPQYINPDYLADRLQKLKFDRLQEAVNSADKINSLEYPSLIYKQILYRSQSNPWDYKLVSVLFDTYIWIITLSVLFFILYLILLLHKQRRRRYGLFLFFIAGLVSLSLELAAFYQFQASAGSLYSEMGALIAAFMIGLSIGTYVAMKSNRERLELPALILMLASIGIYSFTYGNISTDTLLFYNLSFLLTIAMATGALFVAAANRYYFGRSESNRGLGYAFELVGSAIGAIVPTIILLPVIGFQWILISIAFIIVIAIIGAIISA